MLFYNFISAQPIQSLIISLMNGYTRFRLVYGLYNGHDKPIFRLGVGTNLAWPKPTFHTQIEYVRTDSGISQHPNPSNLWPLVCWMVRHGWDLNSSPTTITTPRILSQGWWKFWLGSLRFTPRWVCTDWFSHFISAQPIQSLIISIMNG